MTTLNPQTPWLVLNSHTNADMFSETFDPELQALVETFTKRIASPLPSLSFAPLPNIEARKSLAPDFTTYPRKQTTALVPNLGCADRKTPFRDLEPPILYIDSTASQPMPAILPSLSQTNPPVYQLRPAIDAPRSRDVLDLLSLLDTIDAEMALDCQHMRDNIAEVRDLAARCTKERQERATAAKKRLEKERRETKEIGGDFWAGV